MRKALLWLAAIVIGIPLLLFGLARGASWYLVNDQAKKLARSLAPHVRMEYAGADSALGGPIVLHDVRLRPQGLDDDIRIGRVTIHSAGFREWYQWLRLFFEGRLPERLAMDFEPIRIAPEGAIAQRLSQAGLWPLATPYAALGCFEDGRFDKDAMAELRHPDAVGRLVYEYHRSNAALSLVWRHAVPQAGSLILDASVAGVGALRLPFTIEPDPQLRSLALVAVDDAFHRRRNELCARRLGIAPEDVAARQAAALTQKLAGLGIATGPVLKEALHEFAAKGGEVSLSALPMQPQPLSAFLPTGDSNWAMAMNLEKRRNGVLIVEEASVAREHALTALLARAIEAEKNQPDLFRPVPVADLPKYPQKLLRIHTRDGRVLHVYVDRTDRQMLTVTQHLPGGRATFVLPLAEITKVYVLY